MVKETIQNEICESQLTVETKGRNEFDTTNSVDNPANSDLSRPILPLPEPPKSQITKIPKQSKESNPLTSKSQPALEKPKNASAQNNQKMEREKRFTNKQVVKQNRASENNISTPKVSQQGHDPPEDNRENTNSEIAAPLKENPASEQVFQEKNEAAWNTIRQLKEARLKGKQKSAAEIVVDGEVSNPNKEDINPEMPFEESSVAQIISEAVSQEENRGQRDLEGTSESVPLIIENAENVLPVTQPPFVDTEDEIEVSQIELNLFSEENNCFTCNFDPELLPGLFAWKLVILYLFYHQFLHEF